MAATPTALATALQSAGTNGAELAGAPGMRCGSRAGEVHHCDHRGWLLIESERTMIERAEGARGEHLRPVPLLMACSTSLLTMAPCAALLAALLCSLSHCYPRRLSRRMQ